MRRSSSSFGAFLLQFLPTGFLSFFLPVALVLASTLPASAEKIKDIHPTGYVTDLAGVLTPDSKLQLENLCLEVEQKTGVQMAIVTVRSLEGEPVAEYGNELFKQLGVGNKKDDRGVLLVIAPTEHKYWTEVGYGLEPVITDGRAGDAGRAMVPFLRQGNFSAGVEVAARQLAAYIAADRAVTLSGAPPTDIPPESNRSFPGIPFWLVIFLFFIGARIFSALIRSVSGRGGPRGGGGWWIWPFLGGMMGGGGFRGGSGGWGGSSGGWGGGGFGGFGGGASGGGGAGGSW